MSPGAWFRGWWLLPVEAGQIGRKVEGVSPELLLDILSFEECEAL